MNRRSRSGVAPSLEDRLRFHLREFERDKVEQFLRSVKVIVLGNKIAPGGAASAPERLKNLKRIRKFVRALKDSSLDVIGADWMRSMADAAIESMVVTGDLEPF